MNRIDGKAEVVAGCSCNCSCIVADMARQEDVDLTGQENMAECLGCHHLAVKLALLEDSDHPIGHGYCSQCCLPYLQLLKVHESARKLD